MKRNEGEENERERKRTEENDTERNLHLAISVLVRDEWKRTFVRKLISKPKAWPFLDPEFI